jgi:hypothetical protein
MVATSHWILISGFLLTYIWSTKTQSCPVHLWLVSLLTRWLSTPLSQHNILSCTSESEFIEDGELSYVDYLYLQMNATMDLRLASTATVQSSPNMYLPLSITCTSNCMFILPLCNHYCTLALSITESANEFVCSVSSYLWNIASFYTVSAKIIF